MSNGQLNTNGTNGRPAIRLSLPTLGALSSVLGVVIFIAGFIIGYQAFKSEIGGLRAEIFGLTSTVASQKDDNNSLRTRLENLNKSIADDRQALTNRLTVLEQDIKYISQGVAELRLGGIPKH